MTFQIERLDREGIERLVSWGRGGLLPLWFLPIGEWTAYEVERWQRAFGAGGNAEELGLFIGRKGRHGGTFSSDELEHLFLNICTDQKLGGALLVMSAGFPSPGFSVLVKSDESLLRSFTNALNDLVTSELRGSYVEANRKWEELLALDVAAQFKLGNDLRGHVEAVTVALLKIARYGVDVEWNDLVKLAKDWRNNGVWNLSIAALASIKKDINDTWNDMRAWSYLTDLPAVPDISFARAVEQNIESLGFIPPSPPDGNHGLGREVGEGYSIREWIDYRLRENHTGSTNAGRRAIETPDECAGASVELRDKLRNCFATLLTVLESEVVRADNVVKAFAEREQDLYSRAASTIETSVVQGPALLFGLMEKLAGKETRIVYWDFARMVGARLKVVHPGISGETLATEAARLLRDAGVDSVHDVRPPDRSVDDGLFSDYAHYVYAELARHRASDVPGSSVPEIVDRLLDGCASGVLGNPGWHKQFAPPPEISPKLAQKPGVTQAATHALAFVAEELDPQKEMHAHALRKAAESFVKDLLTVILNDLPALRGDLGPGLTDRMDVLVSNEIVQLGVPGAWLERLTLGDKKIKQVLDAFVVRRRGQTDRLKDFMDAVNTIKEFCNSQSHHRRGKSNTPQRGALEDCCKTMLNTAEAWIGSMPWHFVPTYICGRGPVVAIGRAWRHTDVMPREIRVLGHSAAEFDGLKDGEDLLVWNPSERNPVMTSAVFMRPERPRFSTRKAEEEPHRGSS